MFSTVQLTYWSAVLRQISKRVGEVQASALKHNELLKSSIIALPTLHLTLLVMHIADDMQLDRYSKYILTPSHQSFMLTI